MNIYTKKRRWKWFLFIAAVIIVAVSLWYTNRLVRKIAQEERQKVQLWAGAIQRKASLVKYTEKLFQSRYTKKFSRKPKNSQILKPTQGYVLSTNEGGDYLSCLAKN